MAIGPGSREFLFGVSPIPGEVPPELADHFLCGLRDRSLGKRPSTLRHSRTFTHAGLPALDYLIECQDQPTHMRTFALVRGKFCYVLTITAGSADGVADADADRFLTSFTPGDG